MLFTPNLDLEAAPVPRRDRPRVEQMIRDVYLARYGATVRRVHGELFATYDRDGRVAAACGLNRGEDGFVSQCYLDAPVAARIAAVAGVAIDPTRIVEIGSLAAFRPGAAPSLFHGIIGFSRGRGVQVAVFTATRMVRRTIVHAGLSVLVLGAAERGRVANPQDWGDYYAHLPEVCAILADTAEVRRPAVLQRRGPGHDARIAQHA